jgi:hypothetical protein
MNEMTFALDRADSVAKAKLDCLFGRIPEDFDNLEIVGAFKHEVKDRRWASVWGGSGLVVGADGALLADGIWQRDLLERCPAIPCVKKAILPAPQVRDLFQYHAFLVQRVLPLDLRCPPPSPTGTSPLAAGSQIHRPYQFGRTFHRCPRCGRCSLAKMRGLQREQAMESPADD